MKSKLLIILLIFLVSCSVSKKHRKCYDMNSFNLDVISNDLNKINKKNIYNKIINTSNINISKNSNFVIVLNITARRNNSLISDNNTVEIENVSFITNYELREKNSSTLIDRQRFVIVNDIPISDDRFANFATNNYIVENFIQNLVIKLENRISSVIESEKKCKKI